MKVPIAQPCAFPEKVPDRTIGVFIDLHGQKRIKNNSDLGWGLQNRNLCSSKPSMESPTELIGFKQS
jgi:hypothetical protein